MDKDSALTCQLNQRQLIRLRCRGNLDRIPIRPESDGFICLERPPVAGLPSALGATATPRASPEYSPSYRARGSLRRAALTRPQTRLRRVVLSNTGLSTDAAEAGCGVGVSGCVVLVSVCVVPVLREEWAASG